MVRSAWWIQPPNCIQVQYSSIIYLFRVAMIDVVEVVEILYVDPQNI